MKVSEAFYDDPARTLQATGITGATLIGVYGSPPYKQGNCFSVMANDGNEYKVVNFIYENAQEILARGVGFPISILRLSDGVAVFHDPRIPDEWYSMRFCEICCPEHLLPVPQVLAHKRHEQQGVRAVRGGWIEINMSRKPRLERADESI